MFFNIIESIILLPITIIGWLFGSMHRTARTSVNIACADYAITRVHDHYKKTL